MNAALKKKFINLIMTPKKYSVFSSQYSVVRRALVFSEYRLLATSYLSERGSAPFQRFSKCIETHRIASTLRLGVGFDLRGNGDERIESRCGIALLAGAQ